MTAEYAIVVRLSNEIAAIRNEITVGGLHDRRAQSKAKLRLLKLQQQRQALVDKHRK